LLDAEPTGGHFQDALAIEIELTAMFTQELEFCVKVLPSSQ
jgi:hypothetical protein